mmetsp:Transcript_110473/g.276570  ORF Transcript_110473/g.276570 Transcript_110473/m.276570 type:complete len:557 (+) Transcript_110473:223-1893(+)
MATGLLAFLALLIDPLQLNVATAAAPATPAGARADRGGSLLRWGRRRGQRLLRVAPPRMLNAPPMESVSSSSATAAATPLSLARDVGRQRQRLRPLPVPVQPQPIHKASSPVASATPAEAAAAPRTGEELGPTRITSSGQVASIRPQIFFLFMVYTRISNVEIWERFFEPAQRGVDYTALVHCKSEADCRKLITSNRFLVIPSVETSYCLNLVAGMNALLQAALTLSGVGSSNDKFVFASDSTLPVKPFSYVYQQLTSDMGSDFCIFPRNEWAEAVNYDGGGERHTVRVAPKVHQWLTLNRHHAQLSVKRSSEDMDLMRQLQLNMGQGTRNTGCLDEFWHFATVYKDVRIPLGVHDISLEGFNGGPLSTSNYEIQGRCNTFVHWVQRASGVANNITSVARGMLIDAGTDMVPASEVRPATIRGFGRATLTSLRASSFLFVRKVEEGATFSGCMNLVQAFTDLVFSSEPTTPREDEETWAGNGFWMDNLRSSVTIEAFQGALRLKGQGPDMQGKGYFCGKQIGVTFTSGYKTTAILSPDGKMLQWANGVKWYRPENK